MVKDKSVHTVIDYYSDVLCVWAWIAQPRLEELLRQWGEQLEVRHRYFDVFGDSQTKIASRWGERDGYEKFNAHLEHAAAPFPDTPVHPDLWTKVRPHTSLTAHVFLKAVELVAGSDSAAAMALRIRTAFFRDAMDVSSQALLLELAQDSGFDAAHILAALQDGRAMASLSRDQHSANELTVRGSPTWVLNEGRQVLYGNVGYRILNANIDELLRSPGTGASWC